MLLENVQISSVRVAIDEPVENCLCLPELRHSSKSRFRSEDHAREASQLKYPTHALASCGRVNNDHDYSWTTTITVGCHRLK